MDALWRITIFRKVSHPVIVSVLSLLQVLNPEKEILWDTMQEGGIKLNLILSFCSTSEDGSGILFGSSFL
jgi:hypothetical protein